MVSAVSGTNIDVNTLVTQLMSAERAPLTAIQKTASGYQAKISAYGQLQSSLSSLGDAVAKLDAADTFRASRASSSDSTVLGASASSGATAGTYSIEVQALAQAQKLSSAAFAAADSVVGTGTLSIQAGTYASGGNTFSANTAKAALNITIDSSNNTLSGVRDAINAANGGVRASIVNDGSGFRLAITPTDGGTANSLKITTADSDGNNTDTAGLSKLAYDPTAAVGAGKNLTQNVAPQDALLYIDGVRVVKSSNNISDAISGLTLNLTKTNTGGTVNVTVGPDTDAMKSTLDTFVKAYNSFNSTMRTLTYYDATAKTAGALQGDATARSLQGQVRGMLTSVIGGMGGDLTRLPDIGLTLQTDGSLALDSAKFQAAAASHPGDLSTLFGTTGSATDSRVKFLGAAGALASGSFNVNVTQAATQGSMAGAGAAGLNITAGVNDSFTVNIDGQAASVTLGAGTYASADALAAELQSRLNGDANLKNVGITASVSQSAGVLSITSSSFGSGSSVLTAGGSAAATLFGGTPASSAGVNVSGTINGVAATGVGQSLVSTGGLRLQISSGTGALGSVSFTRGYGSLLNSTIKGLIDSSGPLSARTTGLQASIKRNSDQQDRFNDRMTTLEANYRRQFTALDTMLSSMNTTSNYLTQQLAALNNNN